MRKPASALLVLILVLGGCSSVGDSRLNPLNWFGGASATDPAAPPAEIPPLIPARSVVTEVDNRELIGTVTDLRIERTSGGAIVRATGIAATQGFYNADLVAVRAETAGQLRYQFRVQRPAGQPAIGGTAGREIVVAKFVSDQDLAGIGSIRVEGVQGSRTSRR